MKKKKALFFFTTGPGAGSERMTVNIASFLDRDIYEVQFVLLGNKDGIISPYIPDEYKPYIVHISNIWDFTVYKLVKVLKQEKPNVVFCSLHFLNIRLIIAAKIVGNIKIIIRGDNTLKGLNKLTLFLVRRTYKYCDRIIAQTEELADELVKMVSVDKGKVIVLHNYIDTAQIDEKIKGADSPYTGDKQIRFICTSRCKPEKAQDILLKAFEKVHLRLHNAHLYLFGIYHKEEVYCQEILSYIEDNGLSDCVHIMGFTDNPFVWIKFADCFLLPSRKEGLPNALVESMYIGTPVVACSCIPIIERMVKDGYNGYVVPVDDVDSLANAMIKAVQLNDFSMVYIPAKKEDYVEVFES